MSSLILTQLYVLESANQTVAMRSLAMDIKDELLHHTNEEKMSIPAIKADVDGAVVAWKFNKLSDYQSLPETPSRPIERKQRSSHNPSIFSPSAPQQGNDKKRKATPKKKKEEDPLIKSLKKEAGKRIADEGIKQLKSIFRF